jgi:hypothetical protein
MITVSVYRPGRNEQGVTGGREGMINGGLNKAKGAAVVYIFNQTQFRGDNALKWGGVIHKRIVNN